MYVRVPYHFPMILVKWGSAMYSAECQYSLATLSGQVLTFVLYDGGNNFDGFHELSFCVNSQRTTDNSRPPDG